MKLQLLADGKPVTSFMSTDGKTVSLLQLCKTLGEIIRQEFQSKFDSIMEEAMIKLSETKDQMSDEERVIHEAIKASYDALENPGSKAWNDRQEKLQQMRNVSQVWTRHYRNKKLTEDTDVAAATYECVDCHKVYSFSNWEEYPSHSCDDIKFSGGE